MKRSYFYAVILGFVLSQTAWAGVGITLVGGVNQSKRVDTDLTGATTEGSAQSEINYGALVEMPLAPFVGFETGGIYMTRKFDLAGKTWKYPYLQIPMLVKFNALPWITLGAGPYLAFGMGTPTDGVNNYEYGTGDLRSMDFGLEGAAGLQFGLVPGAKFILEGRYLMGLQNIDSTPEGASSQKWRDLQFLAGVRIGL